MALRFPTAAEASADDIRGDAGPGHCNDQTAHLQTAKAMPQRGEPLFVADARAALGFSRSIIAGIQFEKGKLFPDQGTFLPLFFASGGCSPGKLPPRPVARALLS
jgi:hypothetical protein